MVNRAAVSSPGARSFERGGAAAFHFSSVWAPTPSRGCYRKRRWQDAQIVSEQILERWPEDGPARMYMNRCREYYVAGPEKDWDGVYVMTHK